MKVGLCANIVTAKICYDILELVVGMDSKNIDQVKLRDVAEEFCLKLASIALILPLRRNLKHLWLTSARACMILRELKHARFFV